jgi:cytochrome c oxidase subunit 3
MEPVSGYTPEELKEIKIRTKKMLVWIGIASIVMLFAALTSAIILRKAEGDWLEFTIPSIFYFSTAVIILSSITMIMALEAAKKDNQNGIKIGLWATFVLGIVFSYMQYVGWGHLTQGGVYFAGSESNPAGSFFYILTGLHVLHLLGGLINLLIVIYKAQKRKYNSSDYLGIQLVGIYWHFLDILWVYLLLFLIFIH